MTLSRKDLKQQIVSFFEIHDFGHHFLCDPDDALATIDDIHSATQWMRRSIGPNPNAGDHPQALVARTFFDRTVISAGYVPTDASDGKSCDNLAVLRSVFVTQSLVQSGTLFRHNLFLGGSIVEGDYYRDRDCTIGGVLIDAMKMYEDASGLPRIIVSEGIRQQLEDFVSSLDYEPASSKIDWAVLRDEDGQIFLNYLLVPAFMEVVSSGAADQTRLQGAIEHHEAAIRQMIQKNRDELQRDPVLKDKYRWLIGYHNRVVSMAGIGRPIEFLELDRGSHSAVPTAHH